MRAWIGPAPWALVIWALAILPELALSAAGVPLAWIIAAINLLIGLRFARTLRPGEVPLITRYARCDRMGLPEECEGYTRWLTAAWAGLLGGFALLHALVAFDLWTTAAVAWWEAAILPGFFLGEHVLRSLLMPQLGIATPWRTLSAMRQAARRGEQPHAA